PVRGQDVELRDGLPRLVPDAPHEAIAHDPAVEPEEVRVGPTPSVPGVQDDLAVHLLPMEIAQGPGGLRRHERDIDRHRDLPHAREYTPSAARSSFPSGSMFVCVIRTVSSLVVVSIRHPQSGPGGAAYEPRTEILPSAGDVPRQTMAMRPMCQVSIQC